MATSAERMRARRERARRGIRRLTVDVSDGDLQAMVERGYESAASTDHDQQAQAVGLFLNNALRRCTVTRARSPSPVRVAP